MNTSNEINIPLAYEGYSPEQMLSLWSDISGKLKTLTGFYFAVHKIKKLTQNLYPVYYTKKFFNLDSSLFVPDLNIFITAKQIQSNFGLKSLTLRINSQDNNETLAQRILKIFYFMDSFCKCYNYENNFFGLNKRIHFFDYIDFPYSSLYQDSLYKGICYFKRKNINQYNLSIGIHMDNNTEHLIKFYSHEQGHAIDYILGKNNIPYSCLTEKDRMNNLYLYHAYKNILSLAYNNSLPYSDSDYIVKINQAKKYSLNCLESDSLFSSQKSTNDNYDYIENQILKSSDKIKSQYSGIIKTCLSKDDSFKNYYPDHKPFLKNKQGSLLHPHFYDPEFLSYVIQIEERFANTRYVNQDNILLHGLHKEIFYYIEQHNL